MVGLLVAAAASESRDCTCGMRHWSDQMEQKIVHHGFSPVPGDEVAYRMFQVIERRGRLAALLRLEVRSRRRMLEMKVERCILTWSSKKALTVSIASLSKVLERRMRKQGKGLEGLRRNTYTLSDLVCGVQYAYQFKEINSHEPNLTPWIGTSPIIPRMITIYIGFDSPNMTMLPSTCC